MKKFQWIQRLFAPLIFWTNWVLTQQRGRLCRPRGPKIKMVSLPTELLPLMDAASLAVEYSVFIERPVEELALSNAIQSVIDGTHTPLTQQWVSKVLFEGRLFDTTYDWLVELGDAKEFDRELFRTYLTLPKKP